MMDSQTNICYKHLRRGGLNENGNFEWGKLVLQNVCTKAILTKMTFCFVEVGNENDKKLIREINHAW